MYTPTDEGRWVAGTEGRWWFVELKDECGCTIEESYKDFTTAVRFAYHLAMGGDRWQFVA